MNIKLICMDMDGTLYAEKSIVPKINLRALWECEARGIHLALSSGRSFGFLRREATRLGLNPAIIAYNGARVDLSPTGPTIFEGKFAPREGRYLFDVLYGLNVNFEAYTPRINYVVREALLPEKHRKSLMNNVANGDIEAVFDDERAAREAPERAYKYVAFANDEETVDRVRGALDDLGIEHCSSARLNVELMPKGVGKGAAIEKLAAFYGLDKSEVMAFGDYTNDITMLMAAGHPVAMENGVEELKRCAEIIAPRNTEGGLGQVLYRYVLKEDGR